MSHKVLATDLDGLISRGFNPDSSRRALRLANGNMKQAYDILREEIATGSMVPGRSWMKESPDDWTDYIETAHMPLDSSSRALWKTPIYIRMSSFDSSSCADTRFTLNVTLKDRRQWSVAREYMQFLWLRLKLPCRIDWKFENRFPFPGVFDFLPPSDAYNEQRLRWLGEWIRELCLNEQCMSDPIVLRHIYEFIQAPEHGGSVGIERLPQQISAFRPFVLPSTSIDSYPLSYSELVKRLPCRVSPSLLGLPESGTVSDEQVARDMDRDKVILQGRRLVGALCKFDHILHSAIETVIGLLNSATTSLALSSSARKCVTDSAIRSFCLQCLKRGSRTDSASTCHAALTQLVLLDDAFIVPESSLAKPVQLYFFLRLKTSSGSTIDAVKSPLGKTNIPSAESFSIVCEIRSSTVYRVADMDSLETQLQLSATYYCLMYGLVVRDSVIDTSQEEPFEAYIVLEKETTTTSRDW